MYNKYICRDSFWNSPVPFLKEYYYIKVYKRITRRFGNSFIILHYTLLTIYLRGYAYYLHARVINLNTLN